MTQVGYFLCFTQIWSTVPYPHVIHLCKLWRAGWKCTVLLDAFQEAGPSPSKQHFVVSHRNGVLNVFVLHLYRTMSVLSVLNFSSWQQELPGPCWFLALWLIFLIAIWPYLSALQHTSLGCLWLFFCSTLIPIHSLVLLPLIIWSKLHAYPALSKISRFKMITDVCSTTPILLGAPLRLTCRLCSNISKCMELCLCLPIT